MQNSSREIKEGKRDFRCVIVTLAFIQFEAMSSLSCRRYKLGINPIPWSSGSARAEVVCNWIIAYNFYRVHQFLCRFTAVLSSVVSTLTRIFFQKSFAPGCLNGWPFLIVKHVLRVVNLFQLSSTQALNGSHWVKEQMYTKTTINMALLQFDFQQVSSSHCWFVAMLCLHQNTFYSCTSCLNSEQLKNLYVSFCINQILLKWVIASINSLMSILCWAHCS